MATLSTLRNGAPSSTHTQRFGPSAVRPYLVGEPRRRTASKHIALPYEPEDAKLTGVTRSLARRLLALNISGRLPMQQARIA